MRPVICMAAAAAVLVSAAFAQDADAPSAADADRAAIEKVIEDYFDGIGAADAERLNRAFAVDKAAMVGLRRNDAGGYDFRAWTDMRPVIENWSDNDNAEGTGRDGEILHMNVTDGRIAAVTFRYKDEYYDVLTLLKVDGTWKIATKTFVER